MNEAIQTQHRKEALQEQQRQEAAESKDDDMDGPSFSQDETLDIEETDEPKTAKNDDSPHSKDKYKVKRGKFQSFGCM